MMLASMWLIFLMTVWLTPSLYADFATSLRHTEGRGIGYHRGYTTVEFFLTTRSCWKTSLFPFIDLRGQGFNNRKLAANAGIGVRYLLPSEWVLGANVYYDFRQGSHHFFERVGYGFQQIGVGVEALSSCWDFRFNYYQPIIKSVDRFQQIHVDDSRLGETITVFKKQYVVTSADAEVGFTLGKGTFEGSCIDWEAYLALGPYYLDYQKSSDRWGGKMRLSINFARYYLFEVRTSYDNIFNGTLQLCLGVTIPLYPQSTERQRSCCQTLCLGEQRALTQRVERVEIMPLRSKTLSTSASGL